MTSPTPTGEGGIESARLLTATVSYPRPDIAVCSVAGEVDSFTAPLVCDRLHEAVHDDPRCLVVDLSAVTFMGAAGVATLHTARSWQDHQGLLLVATARPVVRVLELCEVDYPRYCELEQALAACGAG